VLPSMIDVLKWFNSPYKSRCGLLCFIKTYQDPRSILRLQNYLLCSPFNYAAIIATLCCYLIVVPVPWCINVCIEKFPLAIPCGHREITINMGI